MPIHLQTPIDLYAGTHTHTHTHTQTKTKHASLIGHCLPLPLRQFEEGFTPDPRHKELKHLHTYAHTP